METLLTDRRIIEALLTYRRTFETLLTNRSIMEIIKERVPSSRSKSRLEE